MKERPILFAGPMVRAILEGRKTQTRRVCRGQRELSNIHDFQPDRCPYGQAGDKLWVREAWCELMLGGDRPLLTYRADDHGEGHDDLPPDHKWKPSIFMPRWASRITLEITGVRVERVQEISDDDANAEGAGAKNLTEALARLEYIGDLNRFAVLWDSINKARGFGWESNPWVWVLQFRVLDNSSHLGSHLEQPVTAGAPKSPVNIEEECIRCDLNTKPSDP